MPNKNLKESEIRKMRDDFIYYVEQCLSVKDKEGNLLPIVLSDQQKTFIEYIVRDNFKPLRVDSTARYNKIKGEQNGTRS